MAGLARRDPAEPVSPVLKRVQGLLGGPQAIGHAIATPLDAHEVLSSGLSSRSLNHLLDHLVVLRKSPSLEKAVGMSLRTYHRRKNAPAKPLSREQSGRAWKFAEILAKATEVLGGQEAAEQWLDTPAIALNRHRPLDLLATPAGVAMVEDLLERMDHGVYT